jgi:hypothetical protein
VTVAVRDLAIAAEQLGRPPRGVVAVGHRCGCGSPDVVVTEPRLSDGSPFPTLYYLTCPRAASAIGTLEASGVMGELADRLTEDADLRAAYLRAHLAYIADRVAIADVPEIAHVSAGGMPKRVKCLHALVAHSLAAGPAVNPVGDLALARLQPWAERGPCTAAGRDGGADAR